MSDVLRIILVCVCVLAGDPSATAQQPPPPTMRPPQRAWPQIRSVADGIMPEIPLPISGRDAERHAAILGLSVEQVQYLRSHHVEYLQRLAALEQQHAEDFAQAAMNFNRAEYGPGYFGGFRNWRETEDRFRQALSREDERLFMALDMILSEPQIERMPRVRLHRERARCFRPTWRGLFAARIDLSRLVEEAPWPAESHACVDALMWEYEQAFTPLQVEAQTMHRKDGLKREELRHQMRFNANGTSVDGTDPNVALRQRECLDAIAATYSDHARVQRRLAEVNEAFLPRFLAELPRNEARSLEQAFLSQAYQRVYPDVNDPEPLFERLMGDDRLSDDGRALLQAHWDTYRTEYRGVCDAMEKASREWQIQLIGSVAPSAPAAHDERIESLAAERLAASDRFLHAIVPLLPPELVGKAQAEIEHWRLAAARNAGRRPLGDMDIR